MYLQQSQCQRGSCHLYVISTPVHSVVVQMTFISFADYLRFNNYMTFLYLETRAQRITFAAI